MRLPAAIRVEALSPETVLLEERVSAEPAIEESALVAPWV
jgi:hypothetical protein